MSIASVTDRIQQIQSQIAQLRSSRAADAATTAAFATTLDSVSAPAALARVSGAAGSVAPTDSQQAVVDEARKYLGLPYVWGGSSISKGVDCSGLVQSVYASLGYELPRLSADQARSGRPIAGMADAQPGDLIAWDNSSRNNGADHIAIYVGDGKMIEAPRPGTRVRLVDVPSTPDYIRRILPDATDGTAAPTARPADDGGLAAARASFDLRSLLSSTREGAA